MPFGGGHTPETTWVGRLHQIFFGAEGLRAGWGLLLFLLIVFGIGNPVPVHRHAGELPPGPTILSRFVLFGVLALATWVLARIERRPFGVYGLAARSGLRLFVAGLAWGVGLLGLLVLALWQSHLLVFGGILLGSREALRYGAAWAVGFLGVAFYEEFFLRGYLQYTLARGLRALYRTLSPARSGTLGFWTAALVLSFYFGFGHRTNPGESPIGLISAGAIGLVFTFSLWRTGSLWWAIGFHAAWDWAQSFLFGVADSGLMVQGHLLASHPAGGPLLSGGTTGPEGSVYVLPTIALVTAVIALTLPTTRRADGLEPTRA